MAHERTREQILETIVRYSRVARDELLAAESIDDVMKPVAVIEIVFELEEKYGMEIDDTDVLAIVSVEDLIVCVLERLDIAA